jgi:accessory Sec system glycosyltransferase GtfB
MILTASDQIEKLEELVQELPEVIFHVAAHTRVSDKLYQLSEYDNVKVYPLISATELKDLWRRCDFYLDINHYREIDDAVNVASQRNLLILGFENTLHQRELVVKGCIYSSEDYRRMAMVIKRLRKDQELMQKVLLAQQRKRKKLWNSFLENSIFS